VTPTPATLHAALRARAKGLYTCEAAAELLIAHASWLHRGDFLGAFVHTAPSPAGGSPTADIDWPGAISALDGGRLPCSSGEGRVLRIAASLAEGIPANLQDALAGLDTTNVELVARAVLHAGGTKRPLDPAASLGIPATPAGATMSNPAGNEAADPDVTLPTPAADNITGILYLAADVLAHLARDPRVDTHATAFLAELLGTRAQLEDLIDVCRNQATRMHACAATSDHHDTTTAGTAGRGQAQHGQKLPK
jgi:hypothetical protein